VLLPPDVVDFSVTQARPASPLLRANGERLPSGLILSSAQLDQLCDQPGRLVYIVFDQDENQAGQQASQQLRLRLERAGATALIPVTSRT
jgi:hypothetical protein